MYMYATMHDLFQMHNLFEMITMCASKQRSFIEMTVSQTNKILLFSLLKYINRLRCSLEK